MKGAYVFSTSGHTASYKLGKMIFPQLEQGAHGVEVVGMFFFDDNTYLLRAGDPVGERFGRVAAEHGMLLMPCDQCALELIAEQWERLDARAPSEDHLRPAARDRVERRVALEHAHGSSELSTVTADPRWIRLVRAPIAASTTSPAGIGKSPVWCSPMPKRSTPTWSATTPCSTTLRIVCA
jgi:hypothetical protein